MKLEVEFGHPQWGRAVECRCGLVARRRSTRLDAAFGFEGLRSVRLEDCLQVPGAGPALAAVRRFAADPRGWLYLHGPVGDGKTTLLAGAVNALRARGVEAVFAVVPELLDWLKATFDPASGRSFDEDWAYIRAVEVLALDDLGTENATEWARERIYELFNWRYRQRLPTLVTSNLPPDGLADPRLASRFGDVMLCEAVHCGPHDVRKVRR